MYTSLILRHKQLVLPTSTFLSDDDKFLRPIEPLDVRKVSFLITKNLIFL